MTQEQKYDINRDRRKALLRDLETLRNHLHSDDAAIIARAIDWIDGTGECGEMFDGPGGFA